ncbi:MAG TPA: hypothetical protein VFD53_09810 [Ilumatobacter sp.]|nr:hypothetical protein [Ilumatobacter sp.]
MGHPAHSLRGTPRLSFAAIEACESGEGHAVIRIEIGAMPPLLRSIVSSALGTERDLAVMMPAATYGSGVEDADVLIVCSAREPDDCIPIRRLAGRRPPTIVAIDSEGTSATILRVTAESTALDGASDLCDAVRLAARRRTTN